MNARARFELAPGGTVRRQAAWLYLLLVVANALAWAWAWWAFAGHPVLLGTALLAWVFGLRHAVDADHIAAIDNVVRKLMQDGQRPLAVGLYFSLGHSTVVVLASLGVAVGATAAHHRLVALLPIGNAIGTAISAGFLLLIALVNLAFLRTVWRSFRDVAGADSPQHARVALDMPGGLVARLCRPMFRSIRRSWHMYPLGFLFALGFDTATEIGLLGIAATEAARGMAAWQVLVFAALFTAGMALVDTTDSVLMVGAYGWAFVRPLRKLWYNLTITAASVLVALLIGGLEALGLAADQFGLRGGVWSVVAGLNDHLANLGFAVVGIFLLAWLVSVVVYRWKGYDRLVAAELPNE
jgi:high-affinity nickel-transport protein